MLFRHLRVASPFLSAALLFPACGTSGDPAPKLAAPDITILGPKSGQPFKPGEDVVIRGRVDVGSGRWSPTLLIVGISEEKDPLRDHGSRSILPDFSKTPGAFDFETSFPAARQAGKYKIRAQAIRSLKDVRGRASRETHDTSRVIEVTR